MEDLLKTYDDNAKLELAKKISMRFSVAQSYLEEKTAMWEKCYKLYRAKNDEENQTLEPDIKLAFMFGLVEKIVSKLTSPFSGKLPINIKPKKLDQKKQAENYYTMAKDFHNSPQRIIEYTNSTRERVITGSSWETDEWNNIYMDGFKWAQNNVNKAIDVHLPTFAPVIKPIVNAVSKVVKNSPVSEWVTESHKFPVKVGYSLSYPSIFNVFPQPGILKMEDMKWVIEEQQYVSLDDLREMKYLDDNKELQPVYDLSYFDNLKKDDEKRVITPQVMDSKGNLTDFKEEYSGTGTPNYLENGVDSVHLLIMRTPTEIAVTANSQIIQHIKHPFHRPGIKMRLRVYTPDPQSLFGIGSIEPVIPMVEELDDVHNMSMQNWFRSINNTILYDETVVPYLDDFNPRAGGKIRVKSGTDLSRAFMPVAQSDVTGTMITTEANLRGLIETILSVSDFSPGPMGTKPYHSTYGGLMELQQSYAQRFASIISVDQAQTIKQIDSMYWFYEQFMFEPVTIDGSSGAVDYSREDIDTDGHGFLFTASVDPSFGDSTIERNQIMVYLSQSMAYEQFRMSTNKTHWKEANCSKIMEDMTAAFKKGDVDEYMINADETESPDMEFKFMIQGIPVQVNPKENLTKHFIDHSKQLKRIDTGNEQYAPEVVAALQQHLVETQEVAAFVLQNPDELVNDGIMNDVRSENNQPVTAPNFGQNLPAQTGGNGEIN